ncbi:hypothetical protein QQ045_015487 [Rhodiola kirilowii]
MQGISQLPQQYPLSSHQSQISNDQLKVNNLSDGGDDELNFGVERGLLGGDDFQNDFDPEEEENHDYPSSTNAHLTNNVLNGQMNKEESHSHLTESMTTRAMAFQNDAYPSSITNVHLTNNVLNGQESHICMTTQLKVNKLSDEEDDELDFGVEGGIMGRDDFQDDVYPEEEEEEENDAYPSNKTAELKQVTSGDHKGEEIEQHRSTREDNEQLMEQLDKDFETMVQSEALSSTRPNQMRRRVLLEISHSLAPLTEHPLKKLKIVVPMQAGSLKEYSVEVFRAAVDTLDPPLRFEYELIYRSINSSSKGIDSLLQKFCKEKFDAVVGDTTISAKRYYVDFTLPYSDSGIAIVVPRTTESGFGQSFFLYVKPFSGYLWLAIGCVFIITIGFLSLLHRIQNDNAQSLWHHLRTQMMTIFGNGDSQLDVRSILVVMVIGIVAPMLVSVYAGSYSSHIIAYYQNGKVDLNSKDVYIGYRFGSKIVRDLLLEKLKINASRIQGYMTWEDYDLALSKGSARGGVSAIIDETPYLKRFLYKYGSKYKFDGRSYKSDGFAFAFSFDSPHVSHVSKGITSIKENGKMEEIEKKYFGVQDFQAPESSSAYQVQLIHIGGLFISIGIFYFIIFLTTSWVRHGVIASIQWLRNKFSDAWDSLMQWLGNLL